MERFLKAIDIDTLKIISLLAMIFLPIVAVLATFLYTLIDPKDFDILEKSEEHVIIKAIGKVITIPLVQGFKEIKNSYRGIRHYELYNQEDGNYYDEPRSDVITLKMCIGDICNNRFHLLNKCPKNIKGCLGDICNNNIFMNVKLEYKDHIYSHEDFKHYKEVTKSISSTTQKYLSKPLRRSSRDTTHKILEFEGIGKEILIYEDEKIISHASLFRMFRYIVVETETIILIRGVIVTITFGIKAYSKNDIDNILKKTLDYINQVGQMLKNQ